MLKVPLAALLIAVLAGCAGDGADRDAVVSASSAATADAAATPTAPVLDRVTPEADTVSLPAEYVGQRGDRELLVKVEYPDLCQKLLGAHVEQSASEVSVTVVGTRPPDGPCPLRLLSGTFVVELDMPLDDRRVVVKSPPLS